MTPQEPIEIHKYRNTFVATCPIHIEPLLEKEIKSFGVKTTTIRKGAVEFEALSDKALEVLFKSRLSSRVFRLLCSFQVENEHELYHKMASFKWKEVFSLDQTFKIKTVLSKDSRFQNSMFLSLKAKDGIVDWFSKEMGERPNVDKGVADVSFMIRVEAKRDEPKEKVIVGVDLSGFSLNQRGYRSEAFEAPLKENLAAAIIDFVELKPQEKMVDLMCGSGTFIFESILKRYNLPPSFLRIQEYMQYKNIIWDFQNHLWFTKDADLKSNFNKLMHEINTEIEQGLAKIKQDGLSYLAFDMDSRKTQTFKENLKKYGMDHLVKVESKDSQNVILPPDSYTIIVNPPYGKRLGEEKELEELYHNLGENWKKNFKGSRAFVFTGNMELLKKISLRTSKKHILHNGKIECRLAEYNLY